MHHVVLGDVDISEVLASFVCGLGAEDGGSMLLRNVEISQ
jgi:hypothetical protein